MGWLLFGAALTAVTAAAALSITLAGIPLLVAAAAVIHACAGSERFRLRVAQSSIACIRRAEVELRWNRGDSSAHSGRERHSLALPRIVR
jgi:hypothetical protein